MELKEIFSVYSMLGKVFRTDAVLRIVGPTLGAHSLVGCLCGWTPVLGATGGWVARPWVGPPLGLLSLGLS